jgi:sugar lactone lactonase YvrE
MAQTPLYTCSETCSLFFGGIMSPRRLNHPEGILVDPLDGALWCGGEGGELYRIEADGSSVQQMGCSGGFALGLCMDRERRIYLCDLAHSCVVVFTDQGEELARLHGRDERETLQLPNFPVLSPDHRYLYVSDTRRSGGPGIWRFDLSSGDSSLWMRETCFSANGMALAPDGHGIYLVESHLPGVSFIPIRDDGSAGKKQIVLSLPHDEPDGLAFNSQGELFISSYHPSRIYRYGLRTGRLDLLLQDDTTDYLHHCTNLAFRSDAELFSANLGAWHITRIELSR